MYRPTRLSYLGYSYQVGNDFTLAASRAVAPWLDAEAAAGWGRSMVPARFLVGLASPGEPSSATVWIPVHSQVDLVPVTATARLLWPAATARPYAVAGAGAVFTRLRSTGLSAQGWGPLFRAGAGLEWRWDGSVMVGLEGWWSWSRAPACFTSSASEALGAGCLRRGDLVGDGLHVQAGAGWRF